MITELVPVMGLYQALLMSGHNPNDIFTFI